VVITATLVPDRLRNTGHSIAIVRASTAKLRAPTTSSRMPIATRTRARER